MAIRVTDADVRMIIEIDATLTNLNPFIKVASMLVDNIETSSALSTSVLFEIERWLTAHFVSIRDARVSDEKAGSVGVGYQFKLGLGFDVTLYGQTAKRIDTSGYLASLDKVSSKIDAKYLNAIIDLKSW